MSVLQETQFHLFLGATGGYLKGRYFFVFLHLIELNFQFFIVIYFIPILPLPLRFKVLKHLKTPA